MVSSRWENSGKRQTRRWARRGWGDLIGPNPTDRAQPGVKRSVLVEADGGPLAVVIAGANVPDAHLLAATLEAIVLERPPLVVTGPRTCAWTRVTDNRLGWGACLEYGHIRHIAGIRDERPP